MKQYYVCPVCGNIVTFEHFSGYVPVCCGHRMEKLIPGTSDAAKEKHIPVCEECEGRLCVSVGSSLHPMSDDHYIEWIALETDKGYYKKILSPQVEPQVTFCLSKDEKPVCLFAYCNLHGLWASEFKPG